MHQFQCCRLPFRPGLGICVLVYALQSNQCSALCALLALCTLGACGARSLAWLAQLLAGPSTVAACRAGLPATTTATTAATATATTYTAQSPQSMPCYGCLLECCNQFGAQPVQKCAVDGIMRLCYSSSMSGLPMELVTQILPTAYWPFPTSMGPSQCLWDLPDIPNVSRLS
jgi:hypothetical protein